MRDPEVGAAGRGQWPGGTTATGTPSVPIGAIPPATIPVVPKPTGGTGRAGVGVRPPAGRGGQALGSVIERNGVPGIMGRGGQFQPLGAAAAARWRAGQSATPVPGPTPSPSAPPTTTAPPAGGSPFVPGAPGPPVGGPSPGGYPPTPYAPNTPGPYFNEFTDPFAQFFSAIPAMRMNTTERIGDAMAQAGFTGNRWGTSAQRTVGQIGAEESARENAMLQGLLSDFANNQENRALGASGYAVGVGNAQEEAARNRVTLPFGVGAYEQGRQDNFANTAFQDWSQNRLGWLGPFLDFAGRQGAGSPGSPGSIIQVPGEAAKPGAIDWARVLAEFFG